MQRLVPSSNDYTLNVNMPFGDMPNDILTSKFEETDMGDEEDKYYEYSRNIASDWGPDVTHFESEERRGNVNSSYGKLQLLHHGHRGNADGPELPEAFLGFAGPENRDPRGVNVDPDMKQLVRQQEARSRFLQFSPDASEHITGGGISEPQMIGVRQGVFKRSKNAMKVFDRQLLGRDNCKLPTFDNVSDVFKQEDTEYRLERVQDYCEVPQRRVNLVCDKILRDTKIYRDSMLDQDYNLAKYSQARRAGHVQGERSIVGQGQHEAKTEDTRQKYYKAAGLLMAQFIQQKKLIESGQNTDMLDTQNTQIRKLHNISNNLQSILVNINSVNFNESTNTPTIKSGNHNIDELTRWLSKKNHSKSNISQNLIKIYKNMTPTRPNHNLTSVDQLTQDGKMTAIKKTNNRPIGSTPVSAYDADFTEDTKIYNYKTKTGINIKTAQQSSDIMIRDMTSKTLTGKTPDLQYKPRDPNDTAVQMQFLDNDYKGRTMGKLGRKYTVGMSLFDNKQDHLQV